MKIGEIVKIKKLPWKGADATIIDDCYRQYPNGICTMLVKVNHKPDVEVEVEPEEVER